MRRVKRLNPKAAPGQDSLFTTWRHHAVFVTSGFELPQAEAQHRGHAIIEQVIADAAASALAHLPSGSFTANAAWAVLEVEEPARPATHSRPDPVTTETKIHNHTQRTTETGPVDPG